MFWLIFCATSSSHALTVEDLYVGKVFVTGQNEAQVRSGARAGLLQVLVRVSGTNEVQQNSVITNALRKPASYYVQYGFEGTDRQFQIGGQMVQARILRIHFQPSAIANLLREAGFPVWGSNRPSTLIWLAISDKDGRRLMSDSDSSEILPALELITQQRGLPLLFPLLDLEDRLSTAEVWGSFLDRIDAASGRYKPDVILSGRIQKFDGGRWTANWSYRIDHKWFNYHNVATSADELVVAVVDLLADSLAARYAVDSSRSIVEMQVEQIDSLADYADLSRYLQSLSPVLDSTVTAIRDSAVRFRLNTEGQTQQLIEIIELDEKMMLINTANQQTILNYRWLN